MPELPEVETIMSGLQALTRSHTIREVRQHSAGLRWPFPPGLAAALEKRRIAGFARRGKYIFVRVEGGLSLLLHMGMSGRILLGDDMRAETARHEHLTIITEQGCRIGFVDPRRFGCVDIMQTHAEEQHPLIRHLGPEPLGDAFTPELLFSQMCGRRTPVKTVLLDQRRVAGLGNIYVSEILFRARVRPSRLAGMVTAAECEAIVAQTRAVLTEAISKGGSSLRDYVRTDGSLGYFQSEWRVYGREGRACFNAPSCQALVVRSRDAGRSSFYCPACQK